MLSQAFRCRVVGVGTLLRGEIRAKTARGTAAKAAMEKGELLDDHLVLSMVNERVSECARLPTHPPTRPPTRPSRAAQ
jgi:adenylate kinase family enzyme